MKTNPYNKLYLSLAVSFITMYAVMFLNVDEVSHIYLSLNRAYMAIFNGLTNGNHYGDFNEIHVSKRSIKQYHHGRGRNSFHHVTRLSQDTGIHFGYPIYERNDTTSFFSNYDK